MLLSELLAGKKSGQLPVPDAIELATKADGHLVEVDGFNLATLYVGDDIVGVVPVNPNQIVGKVVDDGTGLLTPVPGSRYIHFYDKASKSNVLAITDKPEQGKVTTAATDAAAKLFASFTAPPPPPPKETPKTTRRGLKA